MTRTSEFPPAGAVLKDGAVRSNGNLQWQDSRVGKDDRSRLKKQKPCCVWFTGLSGAGKTTLANLLDEVLYKGGHHTCILDGDRCRDGICSDLDFSPEGRTENVRRIAETAKLMVDAGLIAIVSLISPLTSQRENARRLFEAGEFFEVFVNTPLPTCESRDAKGLYKKARQGLIPNFTGITSIYEPPQDAEVVLDGREQPLKLIEKIFEALNDKSIGLRLNG